MNHICSRFKLTGNYADEFNKLVRNFSNFKNKNIISFYNISAIKNTYDNVIYKNIGFFYEFCINANDKKIFYEYIDFLRPENTIFKYTKIDINSNLELDKLASNSYFSFRQNIQLFGDIKKLDCTK